MHSFHKGFALLAFFFVQNVVRIEHDVLHLVLVGHSDVLPVWNEVDGLLSTKSGVSVRHAQTEVFDIPLVVFHVHQVVVMLLVDFLQVVYLVALPNEPVQESFGESAFKKTTIKDGFSDDHSKEGEERLVVVEALAHVVGHEFAVAFVLHEVSILRIENLVAELGDELFEEPTSVNAFFHLPVLVHELDLPLCSWVESLQENLVKTVFQNIGPVDGDGVPTMEVFALHFN